MPPHEPYSCDLNVRDPTTMRDVCALPQISLMLLVHGWPSLAIPSICLKSHDFARHFEGAVDFDRISTGSGGMRLSVPFDI